MNTISFITANFVAREVGYALTEGWHQGNNATNDFFRPIDTFPKRFEALLKEIKLMGYPAIDLWVAHLHWAWAGKEHAKIATSLLNKHRLQAASMVGNFGATRLEFEAACKLANAIEVRVIVGQAPFLNTNRAEAVELLRKYKLEIALLNTNESNPEALQELVGTDNHHIIGIALDVGSYYKSGGDILSTLEEIAPNLRLVQLKNLRSQEEATTSLFEKGCVPLQETVDKLIELRYNGPLCIEHHPFDKDPSEDCQHNLELVKTWIAPNRPRR